jgi:hypothetical protein
MSTECFPRARTRHLWCLRPTSCAIRSAFRPTDRPLESDPGIPNRAACRAQFESFEMKAFVRSQNWSDLLESPYYLALAPAAAAICYPFLLQAFHVVIGTQPVAPSILAIVVATMIFTAAFVVPFLGIAFACVPPPMRGRDG